VRQYKLLRDKHNQAFERFELLAGIIASTVANNAFGGRRKAAVPSDYMPSVRIKGRAAEPLLATSKEQIDTLRTTFIALSGAVPRVAKEKKHAE
jgi:hypothetical protein